MTTTTATAAAGSGRGPDGSREPVLSFRGVDKTFGATKAVNDVDLDIHGGEVVALLGENGAGKSTLIKILAGIYRPDRGEIRLGGRPLDAASRARIAFIHQDLGLIDWMTAAENVAMVAGYARSGGLIRWGDTTSRAERILEAVGGDIPAAVPIAELSRTDRSLVAIARALALEAEVLVLDEPTASLPIADVERLFTVLRGLKARGTAIIFVTHRLDEVFKISDRIAVMRDGRMVGIRATGDTDTTELISLIVGHRPTEIRRLGTTPGAEVVLRLSDVSTGAAGPVSFDVRAGEMVALTGLRGAGQDVVARAIAGLREVSSGTIELRGQTVTFRSARDAIGAGCAFVTSNRQEEALGMDLSIRENLFLNPALQGRRLFHPLRASTERGLAAGMIERFRVRPGEPERSISTLSGGNQQKVVIARWLDKAPPLIVLEEPTIGVDVGAKAEIYNLIDDARQRGHAMVLVSTDFDEVAKTCSRAFVFNRGRIVRELRDDEVTTQALIRHASAEITDHRGEQS
ncbi:MAG TPA: sugar ABC transporter ATP-binding protein [Mycobacteriales bacterium]